MHNLGRWTLVVMLTVALPGAHGQGKGGPGKAGPPSVRGVAPANGIQWFATWESGKREAERSGRPLLLISAAPHTAGVSGCW